MREAFPFASSRAEALEQWRAFLPRVADYAGRRNLVTCDNEGVSRLSPALRFRLLTRAEIAAETLARYPLHSAEKWLQEIYWRAYWKGWLEQRPQVWMGWRQRVAELRGSLPGPVLERAATVAMGGSGVAIMDYFADELRRTGYLHNHARMWWASFWIHVERLPWELGAEFFFEHLLDADAASNMLSWRWVAGLQTKGKAYLVRRSNLERCCRDGLLGDCAEGLARIDDHRVEIRIPADGLDDTRQDLPDFPVAIRQPPGRVGMWLHVDDASPETGPLSGLKIATAAAVSCPVADQPWGASSARQAYLPALLEDVCRRSELHFGCPAELTGAPSIAAGLFAWAQANRLDHVVAMAPYTGPVADALPAVRSALQTHGVTLHLLRHPADAHEFGFAKTGFFGFWKRLRRELAGVAGDR